jgi:hypothetical protein
MSHSNQLLLKRLEKKINSLSGGPPGPDSVGTSQIINGTITTADIALGTIDISNLSASCIASLGGGGGLTENSVNSSHILDRTILGIDISLGQIGEAHFDASFTAQLTAFADAVNNIGANESVSFETLDSALRSRVLGSTGTFEITNNAAGGNINILASFYYEEDGENYYLFQDETIFLGYTRYLPYFLPPTFPDMTFILEIDVNIDSYSLTYTPPVNGMINHSKVEEQYIHFNIGRNIQNYLEVNITTE